MLGNAARTDRGKRAVEKSTLQSVQEKNHTNTLVWPVTILSLSLATMGIMFVVWRHHAASSMPGYVVVYTHMARVALSTNPSWNSARSQ